MLLSMLGTVECERNPQYVAKEKIYQLAEDGEIISKCPWWIDGGSKGKQEFAKKDAKWCLDTLEKEWSQPRIPRTVVDLTRGLFWIIK